MIDLIALTPATARLIAVASTLLGERLAALDPAAVATLAADLGSVGIPGPAGEVVPVEPINLCRSIVLRLAAAGCPPAPSPVLEVLR